MTWEPDRDDLVRADHRPLPDELPSDEQMQLELTLIGLERTLDELADEAGRAGISARELAAAIETLREGLDDG